MQQPTTHKLAKVLTAGLAAALVALPAAHARLAVDPHHAALFNKDAAHKTFARTDARHAGLVTKAGDIPLIVQGTSVSKAAAADGRSGGANVPAATSLEASGFDWADAAIGAAAGLGLAVGGGIGLLVTRRKLVSA